jgi:hypothetical protein
MDNITKPYLTLRCLQGIKSDREARLAVGKTPVKDGEVSCGGEGTTFSANGGHVHQSTEPNRRWPALQNAVAIAAPMRQRRDHALLTSVTFVKMAKLGASREGLRGFPCRP